MHGKRPECYCDHAAMKHRNHGVKWHFDTLYFPSQPRRGRRLVFLFSFSAFAGTSKWISRAKISATKDRIITHYVHSIYRILG